MTQKHAFAEVVRREVGDLKKESNRLPMKIHTKSNAIDLKHAAIEKQQIATKCFVHLKSMRCYTLI